MKSVARLYKKFQPSNYQLTIIPDAARMTFHGSVVIRGRKSDRPSQRLTFHQNNLTIDSAHITKHDKKGDQRIPVSRINNHQTLHEVRLHSETTLYPGEYTIELTFHGIITKPSTGIYPCYFKVGNEEHVMLATQFESHFARDLFPCIDEPEAKATFDLTIVASKDRVVLSNTPIREQTADDEAPGLLRTTFGTTPRMSTYLLAFVIGELHSKTTQTKRGTEVSIWASIAQPPDAMDFALETAKRTIEFFEDYFGVNYPLPKADNIALPDMSGSVAAMENWGLITYRESTILAYEGEVSQTSKEWVATVIAHETSHQWFGNLVTMKWWDDLWLNESFANMMEYRVLDELFPDWHAWNQFLMREGQASLRRDAIAGVQAVKTAVLHPDQINAVFDPYIVYAKGGRLLYMLMQYIGEETFRKGLTIYFKRHAYGNTTGDDLWRALSEASGVDIVAFMHDWLERSGFPVITVEQDNKQLEISQVHFLESGPADDNQLWPVPLFSNHPELPKQLETKGLKTQLNTADFTLINQGFAGHYIVNYANAAHRAHVEKLVHDQAIDIPDRLMLLNTASMLTKAGYQPFATTLELLRAYENESSEAVWSSMITIIAESRRFIDLDESIEPSIKAFVRKLVAREYQRLGWEEQPNEPPQDQKLRATVLGLGAGSDEPGIVATALKEFEKYKQEPTSVSAELRSVICSVAVREKVPDAVTFLLNLYDTTANSDLKEDLSASLTATQDPAEAELFLARMLDSKLVKPQDVVHWLVYLLRNRHTRSVAWEWMKQHWDWIKQTFGKDTAYDDFPRFAAAICNTRMWQQDYSAFFEPKRDDITLQRNIEIGMNEIETRVTWLERDLKGVQNFFKS